MELRRGGGVGGQAVGRRMDGDGRDGGGGGGGGGCKDAGSEDYENLPTSASVSTHMTAGAMAGILEHSVMYPVDSVKVRRGAPGDSGILPAGGEDRARACKRLHPAPEPRTALTPGPGPLGLLGALGELSLGSGKPPELHLPPRAWALGRCCGDPWGTTKGARPLLPGSGRLGDRYPIFFFTTPAPAIQKFSLGDWFWSPGTSACAAFRREARARLELLATWPQTSSCAFCRDTCVVSALSIFFF